MSRWVGRVRSSDWESFITCPKCGFVDNDMTDYPRFRDGGDVHDGDTATWECYRCHAKAEVTVCVSYEFQTKWIEDEAVQRDWDDIEEEMRGCSHMNPCSYCSGEDEALDKWFNDRDGYEEYMKEHRRRNW